MYKNILVNINKGYIKHFFTMAHSLACSNEKSEFKIYIMHSDLSEADKKLISQKVDFNVSVEFIDVDKSLFEKAPTVKRYPQEIYYRIIAPLLLPNEVDRILYLDCDLIVHNNIDELYNMDFSDNLFVACTQIRGFMQWFNRLRLRVGKSYIYMNTGVMVMNVEKLRNLIDMEKIFKFIKRNRLLLTLYDQDILFKFFGNRIKIVDSLKYNLADRHITLHNIRHKKNQIDYNWVDKNNVIIHYLGPNKPWKDDYAGILKPFYDKYKE